MRAIELMYDIGVGTEGCGRRRERAEMRGAGSRWGFVGARWETGGETSGTARTGGVACNGGSAAAALVRALARTACLVPSVPCHARCPPASTCVHAMQRPSPSSCCSPGTRIGPIYMH